MYKLFGFAVVIVLLQGCIVGDKRTPLTAQDAKAIQNASAYNLVIQDEIRPAVNISNVTGAMGGGLIGAMIDSSINKSRNRSAQDVMSNFYDITQDHDFRSHLATDFNAAISSALPLKITQAPAEFVLLSNNEREKRINSLAQGEALVYSSSFYGFVDNSKELVTESVVYIYTKPAKPTKKIKPIYFNRFVYLSDTNGSGESDSIDRWAADNGAAFRTEMKKSTAAIAEMITMDIKAQTDKFCGKSVKANLVFMGQVNSGNATLIKEQGDRAWVQEVSGVLYSVPALSVKSNPKAKAAKCG